MSFVSRRSAGVALIAGLLVQGMALGNDKLATQAGCATCHAPAKKVLGPSYREIAVRYTGQADAATVLAARVRQGGKGVWGAVPMPPTDAAKLGDADLKALISWILKAPA